MSLLCGQVVGFHQQQANALLQAAGFPDRKPARIPIARETDAVLAVMHDKTVRDVLVLSLNFKVENLYFPLFGI